MRKLGITKAQVKRLFLRSARARTEKERQRLWIVADRAFEEWDLASRPARRAALLAQVADLDMKTMGAKRLGIGAAALLRDLRHAKGKDPL